MVEGGHEPPMSDNEDREYSEANPLSGAVDRRDGDEDAFAEFSDEISESTGLGDDDPEPAD
jgi:hypothetical protein